ncbi:ABC transporter substrate-binding protein [Nocardioides sp. LHG3406-4]|uniref:ABC transporter substrate-binding protein n=1 Tax=Nocardioides sp. LHG3406-4 TaxID=2804575 RepID=UPI003CFA94B8
MASRKLQALSALAACATLLTACSQSGGSSDALSVGYVLPETGGIAFLGPGMIGAAKVATADINDAGGVNGADLKLTGGDEGDGDGAVATQTVDRLLNTDNVSAVIGAAASGVSLKIIDKVTSAGVVQCAPSNTSPTFTDYDDGDFYFRDAPSDALLAPVFASLIVKEGGKRVAVVGRADDYGQSLTKAAAEEIVAAGAEASDPILYDPTAQDFDAEVRDIIAYKPDAMVLIAFDETAAIMRRLIEAGYGPQDIKIYVGTGSKQADLAEQVEPGNAASVQGLLGVNPAATSNEDFLEKLRGEVKDLSATQYTGETYDCVTLVALAAEQAGSNDPQDIADNMQSVSAEGTKCSSFAECKDLLDDDEDIDYDGVSGPIELDDAGDPTKATYDEWEFQADGSIKTLTSVDAG